MTTDINDTNTCSICGDTYTGYGHNADPVNDGRCCDDCNGVHVIPARIDHARSRSARRTTIHKVRRRIVISKPSDNELIEQLHHVEGKSVGRRTYICEANVGTTFNAQTYATIDSEGARWLFWFSVPENQTVEQAFNTQKHHGPFKSDEEVKESQRLVLLGEQCEVTEAGTWDPAWDKPQ